MSVPLSRSTTTDTHSPLDGVKWDDPRDVAVALVDALAGYTVEFSNAPGAHAYDYDCWEERLTPLSPAQRQDEVREAIVSGA